MDHPMVESLERTGYPAHSYEGMVDVCVVCNQGIYEGDTYYDFCGDTVCEECRDEFTEETYKKRAERRVQEFDE